MKLHAKSQQISRGEVVRVLSLKVLKGFEQVNV